MKDFKVKIISPDNEKTELNYFDILFFCQKKTEEYISLSDENLIKVDENNIKLTNKGIDLANIVWEEFV